MLDPAKVSKLAASLSSNYQTVSDKRMSDNTFEGTVLSNIPNRGRPDIRKVKKLLEIMSAGAPNGSLDNTSYVPGISTVSENYDRAMSNPRLGLIGTPLAWAGLAGSKYEADRYDTEPLYNSMTDRVTNPWANLSVGMHELGHAIDMNDYRLPENLVGRTLRNTAADVYRLAPFTSLWKEHAAWRKGTDALIDGAKKTKADPKFVASILNERTHSKPSALGTYWGGTIGGLTGLVGGGLGGLALASKLQDPKYSDMIRALGLRLPVSLGLAGSALGGALGVVGGARLGKLWQKSDDADVQEKLKKLVGSKKWKRFKAYYEKTYGDRKHVGASGKVVARETAENAPAMAGEALRGALSNPIPLAGVIR